VLGYLDQAHGKPVARHELRVPSSVSELESMSTAELAALVRAGREKRLALQAAPEPAEDPSLSVVDGASD
jgi:hypothetical protein